MSVKNFIKENLALTAGIVLPVMLVIFFFAASVIPKSLADPPQYELVFSGRKYNNNQPSDHVASYAVTNGVLHVKVIKAQNPDYQTNTLHIYDPKTNIIRDITPPLDRIGTFAIKETAGATLDTANIAPDGYEFESGYDGSGGLPMTVFGGGGGYRDDGLRLQKNGYRFKIPYDKRNNYYSAEFLGWIVKKK